MVNLIKTGILFIIVLFLNNAHSATVLPQSSHWGTGQYYGNPACPYPLENMSGYDSERESKEVKKLREEIAQKKELVGEEKKKIRGPVKERLKKLLDKSSMVKKVLGLVVMPCQGSDTEVKGFRDALENIGVTDSTSAHQNICASSPDPSNNKICSLPEIYQNGRNPRDDGDRCVEALDNYLEAKEQIATLEDEIEDLEDEIDDLRYAEAESGATTEGEVCAGCATLSSVPKWVWGVTAAVDALGAYQRKRDFDKSRERAADLGYTFFPPYSNMNYFPFLTAGLARAALSGHAGGAYGCAGHGFPYGPYGMGARMMAGGMYGNRGGPFGYPMGQGYPGWHPGMHGGAFLPPGMPGYPMAGGPFGPGGGFGGGIISAFGGGFGGYPGGFGGYPGGGFGGYPGGFGGYPGGFGGGIVSAMGGGFGGYPGGFGGYPGGFGGYPGGFGGYPGGFGGGIVSAMGGGFGGYPGGFGGYPGGFGGMGGGFGGYPGGFGAMGGGFGGYPGGFGAMGGGFGGYPGGFGGMGGGYPGGFGMAMELQRQQQQLYMEFMQRHQEQRQARMRTVNNLSMQIWGLQRQLWEAQQGVYGVGTIGGGAGFNLGGNFQFGVGAGVSTSPPIGPIGR